MATIVIHLAEVNRLSFQRRNRTRSNRRGEAGSYMRLYFDGNVSMTAKQETI